MRTMENGAIAALCLMAVAVGFAHNVIAAGQDNEPAASVTIGGETTFYGDLGAAWNAAVCGVGSDPATLTLLKDIALTNKLDASGVGVYLKLDLNDHVLSYAIAEAEDTMIYFSSNSGHLEVVDQAAVKTKKYFAETTGGIWVLTNETTSLVVEGGVITGAKKTAVWLVNCSADVRDVSFVGNRTTGDGAAMYVDTKPVNVYNTRFYGNVADRMGGAVCAPVSGQFLLKDCDVRHNVAGTRGGGIYVKNKCVLLDTTISDNTAAGVGAGIYFEKQALCLAAGTMILMADGTEKAVEEVVVGDVVRTFDHEGGTNSSARVYLTYEGSAKVRPFTLAFDNGATLSVVGVHGLLEETLRKYVRITEANASTFVGKRFYGRDGAWHVLTGVTFGSEGVAYYSIYSAQHQNTYANGLLTVPDDVDHVLNIYALDANLKADPLQLAHDIATYGLADPDRAAEQYGMDRQWFDDDCVKYVYIAIGKGLVSLDKLVSDFQAVGGESATDPVVRPSPLMTKGLVLGAVLAKPTLDDFGSFGDGVLVLGVNAVVTNNFVGATTDSNIHLATASSQIALTDSSAGVRAGVTLTSGTGVFSKPNDVNYASGFTSDNPDYAVAYTADKTLALRAGIQVGDDAWALIKDGSCSVSGTGDMWSYAKPADSKLWDYRSAIANVVIEDAVTGVGTNAFAYQKGIRDVTIGGAVTNVCEDAFFSCLNVTNLAVGAGVRTVGASAFGRCNSLTDLSFGSKAVAEACQGKAFKIVARITMNGGDLVIDAVPKVTIAGYTRTLFGAEVPTGPWTAIADESNIPSNYRFFKYEYVEEQ